MFSPSVHGGYVAGSIWRSGESSLTKRGRGYSWSRGCTPRGGRRRAGLRGRPTSGSTRRSHWTTAVKAGSDRAQVGFPVEKLCPGARSRCGARRPRRRRFAARCRRPQGGRGPAAWGPRRVSERQGPGDEAWTTGDGHLTTVIHDCPEPRAARRGRLSPRMATASAPAEARTAPECFNDESHG